MYTGFHLPFAGYRDKRINLSNWIKGVVLPHGSNAELFENRVLEKGQLLAYAGERVVEVCCLRGSVWITQDSDVRDVVLEAGDSYRPDRDRHLIVQALTASAVRVKWVRH